MIMMQVNAILFQIKHKVKKTMEMGASALTNFDILHLVNKLNIQNFRGVFCRDELPETPKTNESGIMNLSKSLDPGSHWVAYYKDGDERIYFDSFAQSVPIEIQKYLKTDKEFQNNSPVIQRNTDIVQKPNTQICGHLCVYVIDSLSKGAKFYDIIKSLSW
jgi:hypothetical protein